MIKHLAGESKRHLKATKSFAVVYLAMLVLSLHWATVLYVNSTFLEQFVSSEAVGTLFIIGSALTIFAFLFISSVLRILGNYKLTLVLTAIEFCVLIGLAFAESMRVAVPLFIIHQAVVPLILFNLDVFVESLTKNESETGGKRGIMLTTMSFASALAPLGTGLLLGSDTPHFSIAYMVSAALLIPFVYIVWKNFKTFSDSPYPHIEVLQSIRSFWIDRNLRYVFMAHFLLQLFFAWMVIYVPLYLATKIGLHWDAIGVILFVGLLAYVFLEYPIGRVADLYIGEKEMMATGFFILAMATCWISFITTPVIIPWIVTMFLTRVGASLVETTTETYFFKHTSGKDAHIISFFRITRPLGIVIGALLGSLALLYMPFQFIFVALGGVMLLGIICSVLLVDTR